MSSSSKSSEESFKITFSKISDVKPHEEIIDKNLHELVSSIKKDGVQIDPVVVDESSGVALDGMHRIAALKALDAKRIMVAKVDYLDERIKVQRWLRAVKDFSSSLLDELKVALQLRKALDAQEAMKLVDSEKSPLAIIINGTSYYSSASVSGLFEKFSLIKEFDRRVREFKSILDGELTSYVSSGYMVLYVKKPEKEEVIKAGTSGTLFPPKSTRHIIPYRPVNVRCPLELLTSKYSDAEAAAALSAILDKAKKTVLPPRSVYAGRVYEEELVLFNP